MCARLRFISGSSLAVAELQLAARRRDGGSAIEQCAALPKRRQGWNPSEQISSRTETTSGAGDEAQQINDAVHLPAAGDVCVARVAVYVSRSRNAVEKQKR